jgi:cytochrome oxidase assembly protein ShyY1
MTRYTPPEQSRFLQVVDIVFILIVIFGALWLPLQLKLAGAAKEVDKIENPTWQSLQQTPAQVEQWKKLGYDEQKAHDVIQNHFHYTIDWAELGLMALVVLGYFVFLFRASDKEYRQVIAEKFGDAPAPASGEPAVPNAVRPDVQ